MFSKKRYPGRTSIDIQVTAFAEERFAARAEDDRAVACWGTEPTIFAALVLAV